VSKNSVEYLYASKDLLKNRYHYMYTPFEGPSFLQAYLAQRRTLCTMLRSADDDKATFPGSSEYILVNELRLLLQNDRSQEQVGSANWTPRVLPGLPGEVQFKTRDVLLDLLYKYYASDYSGLQFQTWVETLVKRFEVSKRLHKRYSKELRPTEKNSECGDNYAFLSLLLVCLYRDGNSLKYLNTTLKLVDLIGALGVTDGVSRLAALAATEAELNSVVSLMKEQGVQL
jgi:hypothetical protein